MQRLPVESSDVVAIGYDPKESLLEVEFRGDRTYQYFDVPKDIYDHFMRADSYGTYFNAHINKHYKYRRIDGGAPDVSFDGVAFVTGNVRKFRDLALICADFAVPVERLQLPVEEIQSADIDEVIKHKARRAYALAGRPVVVNDTFWNILALRGFPGAYMKEVTEWLRPEDFLALLAHKSDRTISCTESMMYYDGKRSKQFTKVYWGTIIDEPRGKGPSIDQIVVMQGQTMTIAELEHASEQSSVTLKDTSQYDFVKWYAMQRKLRSFGQN